MLEKIFDLLAKHVGQFNCRVTPSRKLMISTNLLSRGTFVGTISGDKSSWGIESLEDDAPDYLKPLVGTFFSGWIGLQSAIRKAAFKDEVRKVLKEVLAEL